jgi:molybdopterin-guanine dinucleotide biosynthesis protein A
VVAFGGFVAEAPFGAVLAGGESTRYGAPKALATVGGERIVDRVVAALRQVAPEVIISANEPGLFADLGLPTYPDEREGLGPLGGIYTALLRAREAGRPGVLAVACDMPFPSVELLTLLRREAFGNGKATAPVAAGTSTPPGSPAGGRPDIVLPASRGPRGVEPLFGAYSVACIEAIDAALAEGDRRMIGFHDRVRTRTIPLDEVEAVCDPARAFLNVNTPEDRDRAEARVNESEGEA